MRYLVAILKEQSSNHQQQQQLVDDASEMKEIMTFVANYEQKITSLRTVLEDAGRHPDECFNLTAARIDVLEMIGDLGSLQKVCYYLVKSGFQYLCTPSWMFFPLAFFAFILSSYLFDDIILQIM